MKASQHENGSNLIMVLFKTVLKLKVLFFIFVHCEIILQSESIWRLFSSTYFDLNKEKKCCSRWWFWLLYRLRRCCSSGCWDQRDVWDTISGTAEPECSCESRDPSMGCDGVLEDDGYPLRRRSAPTRPPLFTDQPDLTPLIDTNFTSQPPSNLSTPPRGGFDYGGLVERAYMEHEPPSPSAYPSPSSTSSSPPSATYLQRSLSLGDTSGSPNQVSGSGTQSAADWESSVWAMELRGNLIAAGRSSGKLEVRETSCHLDFAVIHVYSL